MTDVATHSERLGTRDMHDHVWRRVGPVNAQYGVSNDEYQCDLCALIWSA